MAEWVIAAECCEEIGLKNKAKQANVLFVFCFYSSLSKISDDNIFYVVCLILYFEFILRHSAKVDVFFLGC